MLRQVDDPFKLKEDKKIYTLDQCQCLGKNYNGKYVVFQATTDFDSIEAISNEDLLIKIYLSHPWIKDILKDPRFVLKGSKILEYLNPNFKATDFDFFVVGVSKEDMPKAKMDFIDYIHNIEKKNIAANNVFERETAIGGRAPSYRGRGFGISGSRYPVQNLSEVQTSDVVAFSNGSVLTICASTIEKPIQLVFTSETTIDDLIFKVDFAVTGLVLTKDGVIGSLEAFYSLMNLIIFIGKDKYPTSVRLDKYIIEKKFGLCIEGLLVDKIPKDRIEVGIPDLLDINGLKIIYNTIQQNVVIVQKFVSKSYLESDLGTYNGLAHTSQDKPNPVPNIITNNMGILMKILHDRQNGTAKELSEYLQCTQFYGKGMLLKTMFERPFLEKRHIQVHFNNILKEFDTDIPSIPILKKYFMWESIPLLSNTLFSDESIEIKKNMLKELVDRQIIVLNTLLDEIVEYCKTHPMLYKSFDDAFTKS